MEARRRAHIGAFEGEETVKKQKWKGSAKPLIKTLPI